MNDLAQVVSGVLLSEGALVEELGSDGAEVLQVISPPPVSAALDIGEWARLAFSSPAPEGSLLVRIESDWPERLLSLFGERGRGLAVSLEAVYEKLSPPAKLDGLLAKSVILDNATYRRASCEPTLGSYLVLTFLVRVSSDESREYTISLCINEASASTSDVLIPAFRDLLSHFPENLLLLEDSEREALLTAKQCQQLTKRALPGRIQRVSRPFLAGMRRRLGRDLDRLHDYHECQRSDVLRRVVDKLKKGTADETFRTERARVESISREYQAKVLDLKRKYAVHSESKLIQVFRCVLPVFRVALVLHRRKANRTLHLDWNPLTRALDPLPCEQCCCPENGPRLICDEQLHIVCRDCFKACAECGKAFCGRCQPRGCSRCSVGLRDKTKER